MQSAKPKKLWETFQTTDLIILTDRLQEVMDDGFETENIYQVIEMKASYFGSCFECTTAHKDD